MARRPDLFQLCPGKKTFSPVSLDSLDIHRGRWKTGDCSTMLELGKLGGGEGVMSQEQGVLYYFGTARTWHLPCSMSKTKRRLVARASCLCWPAVIKFIIWQVCQEGASSNFNHFYTF